MDVALRAALEPVTADELEAARAALESDLARAGDGPSGARGGWASRRRSRATPTRRRRYLEAIRASGRPNCNRPRREC